MPGQLPPGRSPLGGVEGGLSGQVPSHVLCANHHPGAPGKDVLLLLLIKLQGGPVGFKESRRRVMASMRRHLSRPATRGRVRGVARGCWARGSSAGVGQPAGPGVSKALGASCVLTRESQLHGRRRLKPSKFGLFPWWRGAKGQRVDLWQSRLSPRRRNASSRGFLRNWLPRPERTNQG